MIIIGKSGPQTNEIYHLSTLTDFKNYQANHFSEIRLHRTDIQPAKFFVHITFSSPLCTFVLLTVCTIFHRHSFATEIDENVHRILGKLVMSLDDLNNRAHKSGIAWFFTILSSVGIT